MSVRSRKMETVVKVLAVAAIVQLGVQCSMDANAAWKSSSVSHFNVSSVIRHKRYLDFLPKSRMFFRNNIKANVLSANQVLAFAYGFRANYPIENNRKIHRRDIYDSVEEMMNNHGLDGSACMMRIFCEASKSVTTQSGMFFKLFKLIFTLQRHNEASFPYSKSADCSQITQQCPMGMLNLSPYTDI